MTHPCSNCDKFLRGVAIKSAFVTAATAAATVVAAMVVAAATAATSAAVRRVQLLFGRISYKFYLSLVMQVLAGQRMVEVYGHAIFLDHQYQPIYQSPVCRVHGERGTRFHPVVEFSLGIEKEVAVEFHDMVLVAQPESLFGRYCKIKFVSGLQSGYFLHENGEYGFVDAIYKLLRFALGSTHHQLFGLTVGVSIQLILQLNPFTSLYFHIIIFDWFIIHHQNLLLVAVLPVEDIEDMVYVEVIPLYFQGVLVHLHIIVVGLHKDKILPRETQAVQYVIFVYR